MSSADLNKPAIFLGKNQWVLSKAWLWEGCGHCITLISREYLRPAQSSMSIRGELQRAGVRQHKVIYQSSKMSPRSDQWLHILHENVSTHAAFWADCVGWHVWAYFIVSWLQDCHRYTNCGVANHLNKKREEKKKTGQDPGMCPWPCTSWLLLIPKLSSHTTMKVKIFLCSLKIQTYRPGPARFLNSQTYGS